MNEKERLLKELRVLREKKYTLETEINKISNEKVAVIREKTTLERGKETFVEANKKLSRENVSLQEKAKSMRYATAKDLAGLDQKKKQLEEVEDILNDRTNELNGREARLKEKEDNVKSDREKNRTLITLLNKEREQVIGDQNEYCKKKNDFEKEKAKFQSDIEKKKEEAQKDLDSAKSIKAQYEVKLKDVEEREASNLKERGENSLEHKKLESLKKEYLEKLKEAEIVLKKALLKEKANDNIRLALETREQEVEIKRLRVEKIIKEKNITKELGKLQKELE